MIFTATSAKIIKKEDDGASGLIEGDAALAAE